MESEMGSFSRTLLDVKEGNAKYHLLAAISLTLAFVLLHLIFGLDGILSPVSQVLRGVSGTICMVFIVSLMVMHSRLLFSLSGHTEGRLTVADVWLIYISFILEFTCAYILCQVYQPEAFKNKLYHDEKPESQMEGLEGIFRFFFLSISTQTHIGLSDMTPWSPFANLVSTLQMALGMVQIVAFLIWIHRVEVNATELEAILSGGVDSHNRDRERLSPRMANQSPPLLPGSPSPVRDAMANGEEIELISTVSEPASVGGSSRGGRRGKARRSQQHEDIDEAFKGCGRFLYQNLFLAVFGMQFLNGLVLDAAGMPAWMVFSTLTWQILLCVTLLVVSYHLVLFTKVHLVFLAQAYGATSLAFAGAYVALAVYEPMSFSVPGHIYGLKLNATGASEATTIEHSYEDEFFAMAIDYLHFSFAIMTCTGMSDLTPRNMASRGLAGVHMVIAVLFNVVIIGLGMRDFGTPILIKAPGDDEFDHTMPAGDGTIIADDAREEQDEQAPGA